MPLIDGSVKGQYVMEVESIKTKIKKEEEEENYFKLFWHFYLQRWWTEDLTHG